MGRNAWANYIAERPDIVLILADDMGYSELSGYDSKDCQTPHLDSLMRGV